MSGDFKKNTGLPASLGAGFTIIEFIISISIVIVMLVIVTSNQSTYTDGISLSNLADEISVTISQAQAYGVGVRELTPGSSDFSIAYGLTFSLLSSGSPSAYIYFVDRNGNKIYDGDWSCQIGGASECLNKTSISRGNYIEDICVVRSSGGDQCSVGRIDISFVRPTPDPRLLFFNQSGNQLDLPNTIGAKLILKSPGGASKSVMVYHTGQITVQ